MTAALAEDHNPEHVHAHEIPRMRREIEAAIACRASGLVLRPIEELRLPSWVRSIISAVLYQIELAYPAGIPTANPYALRTYIRRALQLFDDEYRARFQLE